MFKSLLARAREARAYELEGGEESLEGGFTLIELMVVLLIIAILLAIAIPTFLGVSGSAKDRSAQSNATNALTNAIAYYQNSQTFDPSATTAASNTDTSGQSPLSTAMQSQEPALSWVDGTKNCTVNTSAKCVSVESLDVATTDDGQGVLVAVMSPTGNCWFVANLQGTPAAVATTGFQESLTANAAGDQMTGLTASPTVITTAGTWYAYLPNAGSNCKASYPIGHTAGFFWGDSYAKASNSSVTTVNS